MMYVCMYVWRICIDSDLGMYACLQPYVFVRMFIYLYYVLAMNL